MFDHFLTSILQIILVLDVLAIVAYVVLHRFKRTSVEPRHPVFSSAFRPITDRLRRHREPLVPAEAADLANLRSVLHSFGDGLG